MMADRFIGKAEAAELLGISPATLDRLAAAGEVPKYKIGGQCRYYEAELISYAKAQRVVPVVAGWRPVSRCVYPAVYPAVYSLSMMSFHMGGVQSVMVSMVSIGVMMSAWIFPASHVR